MFSCQVYYNATLGVSLLQGVLPQQLSIDVPTTLFQRQNNATDDLYSASLVLFVLNRSAPFPLSLRSSLSEVGHRYLNIIGPALGNWQFYSHKFTVESCHKLFLLPTVFRGSFLYHGSTKTNSMKKCSASGYGVTNDNWFTVGFSLNVRLRLTCPVLERTLFRARIGLWALCCFLRIVFRP